MSTSELDNIVTKFNTLMLDDKKYLVKIFKKQIIELKREELLNDIKAAEEEYRLGKIKSGTVSDLLKDIQIIDNWNNANHSVAFGYKQKIKDI